MTRPSLPPTYEAYVIHQIMPAPGWQAVCHHDDGTHWRSPSHALGLSTRRVYTCRTRERVDSSNGSPDEELREVVGLDYDPGGMGFEVCDSCDNYCGLLPPEATLANFDDGSCCHHRHAVPAKPDEETP